MLQAEACDWVVVISVLQVYHQELTIIPLNYHNGRTVLGSMCVGVSVWLGLSGIHVAGISLQHGYHSNPTTPKQEHTTNVVIQ